MTKYEYLTIVTKYVHLQAELSRAGAQGWKLHTCDFTDIIESGDSPTMNVLAKVIMEREADYKS